MSAAAVESTGWLRKRSASARGSPLALIQLALAAAAIAGIEIALFVDGTPAPLWGVCLQAVVALEFVGAGVLAWDRRPSNRTGALLCLCGFSMLASGLANTVVPWLIAVGFIFAPAPLAVILHLLLAFPSRTAAAAARRRIWRTCQPSISSASHLRATRAASTLVCRYLAQVQGVVNGKPYTPGPAPRLSVFVWNKGRWQLAAHANFNPLKG